MYLKRFFAWFLTTTLAVGMLIGWAVMQPDPVLASSTGDLAALFIPGVAVGTLTMGSISFALLTILQGLGHVTGSKAAVFRRPRVYVMGFTLLVSFALLHFGVLGWMITLAFVALENRLPVGRGKVA